MLSVNQKLAVTLVLLALIGMASMLAATRFGIGVSPDSTVYLDAARNLSQGKGLVALDGTSPELKPLTHYPPLYPSLLALIGGMGISTESAARWLNAVLLGANLILVGLAIRMVAPHSYALPVLGAFLSLSAPDLLTAHSFALTEPLFIFLTIIALLFLAMYMGTMKRAFLMAAAAAMALSMLTRYVGVTSLIAGVVALLVFNGRDVRKRLIDAAILGAVACAPMGLWVIRNRLASGGATDRQLVFHPVKLRQLISGASTVSSWFLLGRGRGPSGPIVFVVELLAIIAGALFLLRQGGDVGRSASRLPHLLSSFVLVYVAFLMFTVSFIEADTVFDHRSLVPVHVAVLILGLWLGHALYLRSRSGLLRAVLAIVALAFVTSYGSRGGKWFLSVRQDGQGYAGKEWQESATISSTRTLPPNAPIYSNGYDAIYFLVRRPSMYLPQKINHSTGQLNANYEMEIEKMDTNLKQNRGFLVYFKSFPERSFLPPEDELRKRLHLRLLVSDSDGSIYSLQD